MRGQRGLSASLQWTLLTPLVLLCLLGAINWGIAARGQSAANQAAWAAAEIVAQSGAAEPQAITAAERIAARGGLASVSCRIVRSRNQLTVHVSGSVSVLLPIFDDRITQHAVLPLEGSS